MMIRRRWKRRRRRRKRMMIRRRWKRRRRRKRMMIRRRWKRRRWRKRRIFTMDVDLFNVSRPSIVLDGLTTQARIFCIKLEVWFLVKAIALIQPHRLTGRKTPTYLLTCHSRTHRQKHGVNVGGEGTSVRTQNVHSVNISLRKNRWK